MQIDNKRIVVILVLVTILSLITPIYAQKEVNYKVSITNIIEGQGGSLKTHISITPSQEINSLTAYIPKSFLGKEYIIVGFLNGDKFMPEVSLVNDTVRIQFNGINVGDNQRFIIEIYIPNYTNQSEKGFYTCKFLSSILLDHPIASLVTQVKLPPNTKAVKPPQGYSQFQITPQGVKPELHRLEKTYSIEELEELEVPHYEVINMSSTRGSYASIKLIDMNISIIYTINPDSTIHGKTIMEIENIGNTSWKSTDYLILYKRNDSILNLEAHTQLNRELKTNSSKNEYRIQLPFDIKPGDRAIFVLEYDLTDLTKKSGLFGEKIDYNISISNITENTISLLNITILKPNGEVIYTHTWLNYNQYSDPITIEGETNIQPLDLIIYSGAGYIVVFIIIAGIILSGYQLYVKSGLRELPEEARKYFNKFRQLTDEMSKLIELENRKIQGKITEREYLKRRADLNKKISQIKREIDIGRKMIEEMASENSYVKEVLDEIKEIEKYWSELQRIDEGFRRKRIKPEKYKERRKETIAHFKTHLTRLESKL